MGNSCWELYGNGARHTPARRPAAHRPTGKPVDDSFSFRDWLPADRPPGPLHRPGALRYRRDPHHRHLYRQLTTPSRWFPARRMRPTTTPGATPSARRSLTEGPRPRPEARRQLHRPPGFLIQLRWRHRLRLSPPSWSGSVDYGREVQARVLHLPRPPQVATAAVEPYNSTLCAHHPRAATAPSGRQRRGDLRHLSPQHLGHGGRPTPT